jgi:nucleotide-binding universal stress UspA family protein
MATEGSSGQRVVVGVDGPGAFAGMLTGSVSIHWVNKAGCPVVVRGAI